MPNRRNASFRRKPESSVVAHLHALGTEHFLRFAKKWSVPVVLVFLGGCGFTLRGSADLPPALQTMQVESTAPDSGIVREISRMLRNNDVTLTDTPGAATWRLEVGGEEFSERVLSVNANARAGEYELTMNVALLLRRGTELLGPETLSVSRVYLADPESAVAKNEEAELIRTEMRRELAQQVLRRLQSLQL
jgi:LPS-assembly lipoprotein